jgi:hypothetical protein
MSGCDALIRAIMLTSPCGLARMVRVIVTGAAARVRKDESMDRLPRG